MRPFGACFLCALVAVAAGPLPLPKPWDTGWQTVDCDKDCRFESQGGKLTITLPAKPHRLYGRFPPFSSNAPCLLREVEGDFAIEVRVPGLVPKQPGIKLGDHESVMVGLLIEAGDKGTLSLLRQVRAKGDKTTSLVRLERRRRGGFVNGVVAVQAGGPVEDVPVYLRLERKAGQVAASYRTDHTTWVMLKSVDKQRWVEVPPLTRERKVEMPELPRKLKVGVMATTTVSKPFMAEFSGLKLTFPK